MILLQFTFKKINKTILYTLVFLFDIIFLVNKMIRYYVYLDIPEIQSLYNQLNNNITEIINYNEKKTRINGDLSISLPESFKYIFKTKISGNASKEYNSSITTQKEISIEEKISKIIEHSLGNETKEIDFTSLEDFSLISGQINVLIDNLFELSSQDIMKKLGYKNLNEFISKNKDNFLKQDWKTIINKTFEKKMQNSCCFYSRKKDKNIGKFIVYNTEIPTICYFSNQNILYSASHRIVSPIFSKKGKINIMGILYKYHDTIKIKPVAIWYILNLNKFK